MKKLAFASVLFGVVALILVLAIGSAVAAQGEPEVEPEPGGGEGAEAKPSGSATRINFEFSDHAARAGTYIVQETGGRIVASWYALDGWRDSGWINNLDISHDAVHVRVLYYPYAGAEPTVMRILNPAGGTEYGWLARGMEHALEVAFPDAAIAVPSTQPVAAGVPTGAAGGEVTTVPAQPAEAAGEQLYVVQAGNNLFRIGLQFGCSYLELAAYNGIPNPDVINVGQQIRIPANCVG
jgi:hypothetical protein